MNTNRSLGLLQRRPAWISMLAILTFFSCNPVLADSDDTDTAITGTDDGDVINVDGPTGASALILSGTAVTATATATVVDSKDGDDTVTINADIDASGIADMAILADPGEAKAQAFATGVSAGDGDDVVFSGASIDTSADAIGAYAGPLAVDNDDIGTDGEENKINISIETKATSTSIDGGDGDDTINSSGPVDSFATAVGGGTANQLDVTLTESVTVKAESITKSSAAGIQSGAGNDHVITSDTVDALATAVSGAVAVGVVVGDTTDTNRNVQTNLEASAKAEATATGIATDTDATEDSSEESSPLGLDGLQVTYNKTVSTISGDDTLTVNGEVSVIASAISGSAAASVAAEVSGSVVSTVKSDANATSTALSTGAGRDTITNTGALNATSTALAGAVNFNMEIGNPAPAKDKQDKSSSTTDVTAKATAIGIDAEGEGHSKTTSWSAGISDNSIAVDWAINEISIAGDDAIDNRGAITTSATAGSRADGAAITIASAGSANSDSNSTAKAKSVGIFTGGGNDQVSNIANIDVKSAAAASAVSLGLSAGQSTDTNTGNKLGTKSSTKSVAESSAIGIDTEGDASLKTHNGSVAIGADGLSVSVQWGEDAADGGDIVDNSGAIKLLSIASADSTDASVTIQATGSVDSDSSAKATADATAIYTGAGSDDITNNGALTTIATSDAGAIALSLTVTEAAEETTDPPPEKKDKSNVKSEASATAVANALGIDAEGDAQSKNNEVTVDITGSGLDVSYLSETTSLSGDDIVDNQGNIISVAAATTGAIAAGVEIEAEGSVSSKADSNATAKAGGIYTGGGSDDIDNSGDVDASAVATAGALSAGVTVTQPATDDTDPTESILDKLKGKFASTNSTANATSEATTYGIDAEGTDHSKTTSVTTSLSGDGLFIDFSNQSLSNSGADTVINSGDISLLSIATSGAGATEVRVQAGGTASSEANAKATANSTGINTGGGNDSISNDGSIIADSIASAGAIAVSFSQDGPGAESKAAAKATSESKSVGISADGGNPDKITTSSLAISENGIDFAFNHSSTAQSGVDDVINAGSVTAIATSTSAALGAAITIDGAAEADVTSTARSSAVGIDLGGDSDTLTSSGGVSAVATSTAGSLGVGFGQKTGEKTKPKVTVKAAATAESEAIGIAADSGKNVTTDIGFSLTADGLSASFRHETIAASGDDVVDSAGPVTAVATSNSGVGAAAVAIDGAASVDVNATGKSTATAFETGGGNDVVISDGVVTATATSTAVAVGASVGQNSSDGSKAKAKVDAETTAEAVATGISTDGGDADSLIDFSLGIDDSGIVVSFETSSTSASGDDSVTNLGSVTSVATATSALTAVSVSIKGAAQSKADTTAKAEAFGINTGGGTDTIDNSGELTAISTATAATANVTVSTEGSAISNSGILGAGTTATSNAVGINSSGSDYGKSLTVDTAINFDDIGVTVSVENSNDSLTADGVDTILNSGNITAFSTATAPQVTAAVTSKGIAASIGRAKSTATATAIESGNLGDVIDNSGDLSSAAISSAYMVNVAVTGKGLAVAGNNVFDGGTEAQATATGIDADSGSISTTTVDVEINTDRAQVLYETDTQYASGDDQITNTGAVDTLAVALAPGVSVAVAPKGVSAAVSTSKAKAESTGIKGGDGDDDIDNDGSITSMAEAMAVAANVSVTNAGVAAAADAVWDGGTTAEATAIGIAGDGGDVNKNTRLAIGTDEMSFDSTTTIASGTDTIYNTGNIVADANAVAASAGVAVAVKGVGIATSTATAKAEATAIDAGAGEEVDNVYNSGDLSASARAGAAAASVAITNSGLALSADSVWDGGTGADARSRGIYLGEGGESLTNDGNITTEALAGTASVAVSVAVNGVAGATATSTATADSTAIDASEGNDSDTIINNGNLAVDAHSLAASASVAVTNAGLAIAADAVWDGGTGATSRARGIDVGQGADSVLNTGDITTNTSASAGSLSVAVTNSGVAVATATSTADADSVAIDMGEEADDDTIENSGTLTSFADANAISGSVSVVNAGLAVAADAVWDGGTGATALARGIAAGEGTDLIDNSGAINADSLAITGSLGVSVAINGVAGAIATATGDSRATAIDAGDGNYADTVINSGNLHADAVAVAATVTASVTTAGVAVAADAVWDGGTGADAHARGIDVSEGADQIDNSGDIDTLASASTASAAVSVAIKGVAGATAQATGTSTATAIDTGEGLDDDEVINSGNLTVLANSNAAAAAVSVTTAGVAVSGGAVWDGGTTADSRARGIDVGAGASGDTITNTGNMDIDAISVAAEASVSVAVAGVGVSISTSTGLADASAIDASQGDDADTVINTGDLDVNADAFAATATVAVTPGGLAIATDSVWDGGTTAESRARGIETGFGSDTIDNEGNVAVLAISGTGSVAVSVPAGGGVGIAVAVSTSEADATALDAGDDDSNNTVLNSGDLDVEADAVAASAAVAFTVAGVTGAGGTPWDGGTTAESAARGITVGDGNDTVISSGTIDADSLATATGVSVAVAVEGVAGAVTAANATAQSVGIDTAAGDDTIGSSNTITTSSIANANTLGFAGSKFGMSVAGNNVWDGGTTAIASTTGINAGAGADLIDNDGAINSTASAIAPSATVSFNVIGVAAAISTATAEADATAIDAGDDNDVIDNSGQLSVDSTAVAASVNAAITGIGVAATGNNAWDGGTSGAASSTGITGGAGLDSILNSGDIETTATVVAPAVTVAFSGIGVAAAVSTASADADSTAIDGAADDDRIDNLANLDVSADAVAVALNVSITGAGVAVASDSVWDGGTTSTTFADGIDAGDGNDVVTSAAGNTIAATATSTAVSVAGTYSANGFAASVSTSTANADANAINAGSGNDIVLNDSDLTSTANANAYGISVAVTGSGGAFAADSIWDGGSKANANAAGINLGSGNDQLANTGIITATADSDTLSASVAASGFGMAGSFAASTSTADAAAIDGGSGDDILINEGSLTANADADAIGISVALTNTGAAIAGAFLDNATRANAFATGMDGGDGADSMLNAEQSAINVNAEAQTTDIAIALALQGIAAAESTAISTAGGTGLDGGDGNDVILNEGAINATSDSAAVARTISLTMGGLSSAEANAIGLASTMGIAGGTGDDRIDNLGTINITATADSVGQSISVAAAGAAFGEANANAISGATGISGVAGADEIVNAGEILIDSVAGTDARTIVATVGGLSIGEANATSNATATGIDGGDEDDIVINTEGGVIDVRSVADTYANSITITIGGLADGEARTVPVAFANGLVGGGGDDGILNEGELNVLAKSKSYANSTTISFAGVASAKAGTEVETEATGISGGTGADVLINTGKLRVGPADGASGDDRFMSVLDVNAVSATFAGGASAESAAYAKTTSTGMDGGDDDDQILNDGDITVVANALSRANASSIGIFGSSDATGGSGAFTFATGLAGGAGDDLIESLGLLDVSSESRLVQTSSSFEFGGSGDAGAALEASTDAIGISGSAGQDQIRTDGTVDVTALSSLDSKGGGTTIFGSSNVSGQSRGVTRATGIAGGDDDDIIENEATGTITVTATTVVDADSVAYTFGGKPDSSNLLTGQSSASGIIGGQGDDQLFNDGTLNVTANAELTAKGGSKATFTGGASDATGTSTADTHAIGMGGGDGDDILVSTGVINVNAITIARAQNNSSSSASFTSDNIARSISDTAADAVGLRGGDGSNTLVNEGTLTVNADSTAYAFTYANGATFSFDGDAQAYSTSTATAIATGFSAENENNTVINDGQLFVTASAGTAEDLESTIIFYRLQGDYEEGQQPDEKAIAIAVDAEPDWDDDTVTAQYADGDILYCKGDDCTENDSDINTIGNHYVVVVEQVDGSGGTDPIDVYSWERIEAVTDTPNMNDPANQAQYFDRDIVACTAISCREDPAIQSSATYWQLSVTTTTDDPPVPVYSWERLDGLTIEVSVDIIEASFPTYAAANGNGLDGDGVARGTGVTEAHAYGVRLGDGDNTIQSNDMRVLAEAIANINGVSDGDVVGDSRGYITADAFATAVGIELGVGSDTVWNTGTLSVTAAPSAQAFTEVHAGDGVCIWFFGWWCIAAGDGIAEATANFTANAAGILAGNGDNSITNDGSIIVTAAPNVAADIRRNSEYAAGSAGDNTSGPIHTVNSDSTAIGILTGDGNDIVINNGDIIVKAMDILSGCDDENGDCGVSISDQGTLTAIAIMTGDGDDTLINNGSIAAYTYRDVNASSAIGVDLGIGNDALTLGDQSEIIGSVDLGLGDDSLTLIGTPVVWDGIDTLFELPGGEGTDSLFLIGDGFYAGPLSSFEIATKSGAGTYALTELATLESLTIDEGTLELGSSYNFAVDGEFYSYVHSEGDSGLLSVIGSSVLDGAINIERRGETFIANGTRYTIITTTDGVSNGFNNTTLPEPMPLLSFALEQTLDGVDIVATAESFAFTANNRLHRFVASNLNSIAGDAVGDFNEQLGTIQRMASGFDIAFASLAPDAFQALTANTISTAHETTQLLRHHLSDARAVGRGEKSLAAAYEPVAMSYDGMLAQVARNGATSAIGMPQTQHQIESASSAVPGYRPSKWLTWMDAFSGSGDSDLVDGYTQYEHDASGFSIGLDRMLDNDLIIGLTIGFSDTDLSLQDAVADAAIESWSGTLYATKYSDRAYVEGGLYFANQTIDTERHLTIDSLERTATSRHDGETFMAFLSGGYRFDFDRWYLEPYGSLFYFDISEDGFEETGADGLNQILSKKSANAMIGEIGTKFVRLQATSNGMIDWHASVAYNHDFGIDDMQIDYAYVGDPDAFFTIPDRNITSGSSVFGAGIAYIRGRSTFGLEYRGQYNSQYNSQIIGARLAYEF